MLWSVLTFHLLNSVEAIRTDSGVIMVLGRLVTLFRMSYDAELQYIVCRQHFGIPWVNDFRGILQIMGALVRHVVGLLNPVNP